MKSTSATAVVENSNTQVEEVAAEHTSSAKGGKFESRRDNMETFIADHCLEQAADAVMAEAHPTAEAEDHVPASCRDIEFDSLESEEVLDKMVVLRKELEETKGQMLKKGLSARILAWTLGLLLRQLKAVHERKFREIAEDRTGISQATITRYLKLAKSFKSVDALCAETDSLKDAYLRVGALGKEGKTKLRVFDRARKSLSAAVKLVEKVGQEGEVLSESEVGKLRALADTLGELLQKLASSKAAETSEAIAA
jgi:predicted DNA-binding WGR domain protein